MTGISKKRKLQMWLEVFEWKKWYYSTRVQNKNKEKENEIERDDTFRII